MQSSKMRTARCNGQAGLCPGKGLCPRGGGSCPMGSLSQRPTLPCEQNENITLPRTTFAGGKYYKGQPLLIVKLFTDQLEFCEVPTACL